MVSGESTEHSDHIIEIGNGTGDKLLKAGVIYGGNAAGKSNLVKALRFAQEFIVSRPSKDERIGVTPFLLDPVAKDGVSQFEFEIKCSSGTYIYTFDVNNEGVHTESLRKVNSTDEKAIYVREQDESGNHEVKLISPETADEKDLRILEITKEILESDELYLSKLIDNKVTYLKDVYGWFKNTLKIILPDGLATLMTKSYFTDEEFEKNSREIIQLFNLGIDDVSLKDVRSEVSPEEKEDLLRRYGEDQRNVAVHFPIVGLFMFLSADKKVRMKRIMTLHEAKTKNIETFFDMNQESDGTQRLFELSWAIMALLTAKNDQVLFIDEIDLRLHPHITKNIFEIFLSNSASRPSQLIATTHEAGLLDLDLLRRDEIWFVEKDHEGNSNLYSLEEFVPEYGRDIQTGYLIGRFGAIPIVPSYNVLDWAN